jgi:hypothetical protein
MLGQFTRPQTECAFGLLYVRYLMLTTLTSKETRIVRKVSQSWWPKVTLYFVLAIVLCGVLCLALAIFGCVKLHSMAYAGIQPATITVLSETWISLMMGGIALMSAIFMWGIRSYGLLIRKLGDNHDA